MQGKKLSPRSVELIFLSVTGILFYWLNWYSVLAYDDWYYAMICEDADFFKPVSGRSPIESIGDIFVSQWNHYQYVNGRFLLHFIVQLFVGLLGLRAFQVANTVMFVLLMKYLCRLCIPVQHRDRFMYYILTFLIFWFIMGMFMEVGFAYLSTIAFAVNYLWSATLFVWVIYEYYKNKDNKANVTRVKKVVVFMLALLCGASNESFAVGLSAALFIYYCAHPKAFIGATRYLAFGLWIGTASLVFAPANFQRFVTENDGGLVYGLKERAQRLIDGWFSFFPIIIFLILLIVAKIKRKKLFRQIASNKKELLWVIVFSFAFLSILAGFAGATQMFSSIILSEIIILLPILYSSGTLFKNNKLICSITVLALVVHYVCILQYRQKEKSDYDDCVLGYLDSDMGLAIYRPIDTPRIISAYGINMMTSYRMMHNLTGISVNDNMKYGFPVLVPDLTNGLHSYQVVENNDSYAIHDAGYFWVVNGKDAEDYSFEAKDFQYNSLMLGIWFKYISSMPEKIEVKSDCVTVDGRNYIVIRKSQEGITINKLDVVR